MLPHKVDPYGGVIVSETELLPLSQPDFLEAITASLQAWRAEGRRGVWLRVPMAKASFVEAVHPMGFECHHTKDNVIVLTLWLPETTNKIPPFCRHYVGVGAIIVRDPQYHTSGPPRTEILVIQERYMSPGRAGRWKLVTGLVEGGEDLHRAVEREALEETGVQAVAEGLCCFRQFHGVQFGCSDLHFVFLLQARSDTVQIDPEELLAARWIDVDEFLAWNQADAGALEIVRASIEAVRQRRPCLAGAQLGGYIGTLFTPPTPTGSATCSSRSAS